MATQSSIDDVSRRDGRLGLDKLELFYHVTNDFLHRDRIPNTVLSIERCPHSAQPNAETGADGPFGKRL